MLGVFLHRRWHNRRMGLRVASERARRYLQPLPEVRACLKFVKVSSDDMQTRSTTVRHVGEGVGSEMHGCRGVILWTSMEIHTMPLMWYWTDLWVHDVTSDKDVGVSVDNRLEPAAGKLDGTPTPGIWRQIPKIYNTVTIPLFLAAWGPFGLGTGSGTIFTRITGGIASYSWRSTLPLSLSVTAAENIPPRDGLTVSTTSHRSASLERRDGSGGRPCSTVLGKFGSTFGFIRIH